MPKVYSTGDTLPAADLNGIAKVAGGYAASATGNDSYVVTLTPAPTSYAAGDVYYFKADVANTGSATLNVNSLGAKTIKKMKSGALADLETGDIAAGQIVAVAYDGTYLLMLTQLGEIPTLSFVSNGSTSGSSSSTQNIDTTFTPGFKAKTILIYYKLQGKTATPSDSFANGLMYFTGTSATLSVVLDSTYANMSMGAGSNPAAGDNSGNGIKITLSITSLTSTQFTIRQAYEQAGISSASALFSVVAWG